MTLGSESTHGAAKAYGPLGSTATASRICPSIDGSQDREVATLRGCDVICVAEATASGCAMATSSRGADAEKVQTYPAWREERPQGPMSEMQQRQLVTGEPAPKSQPGQQQHAQVPEDWRPHLPVHLHGEGLR